MDRDQQNPEPTNTEQPVPGEVVEPATTGEESLYQTEESADEEPIPGPSGPDSVGWSASEFMDAHKKPLWFVLVGIGAVAISVGVFLAVDWLAAVVVLALLMLFISYGARKPRVLDYHVDDAGVRIADKLYRHEDFRSFSVDESGGLTNIVLFSNQRFAPSLTLYVDPNDSSNVFDILSTHIPFEKRTTDWTDKLSRRIGF